MRGTCARKGNKQIFLAGFILLLAGLISFFYWGGRKQVWFCDEIYTYESANGFEQAWPETRIAEWMTGDDIEDFFSADSDYISLNDITVRLYNDHVPLYFWLFRVISFFFFKGSGTIWIGLSINLVFYLAFLGLGYRTFLRLTDNAWISSAVMLLTGVANRLMIEQMTMLRMYMMLLLAEYLLLLAGMRILQKAEQGKISPGTLIFLYFVSVAGFLTHYDYWIFYAVTAALFCLWLLASAFKRRGARGEGSFQAVEGVSFEAGKGCKLISSAELRYVLAWIGNFIASLLSTIYLFPYCRWNLNRGKGQTALKSVFVFSADKVKQILWGYQRLAATLFGEKSPTVVGLLIIFGCIAGGMVILYKEGEKKKLTGMCLTVLISQLYQFIVCFTMPAGWEERYLWCVFTFMALCMAYGAILLLKKLFLMIQDKKLRVISRRVTAALLIAGIAAGEFLVIDNGNGIAYLFPPEKNVAVLKENSKIPWVVYGPAGEVSCYFDWMIAEQICFLTSDDTAEDRTAVMELQDKDKFILYSMEEYLPSAIDFFERQLGRKVTVQYLTRSTNLLIYQIEIKQAAAWKLSGMDYAEK